MRLAEGGAPLSSGFPDDAARLATLMRNDPHVQLAFMALVGWDTHANQGASTEQLANHLTPLGQGLADGQLYEGRDVPVTTDFRLVLAQIAERHLRLSDQQLQRLFPALPKRASALQLIRT